MADNRPDSPDGKPLDMPARRVIAEAGTVTQDVPTVGSPRPSSPSTLVVQAQARELPPLRLRVDSGPLPVQGGGSSPASDPTSPGAASGSADGAVPRRPVSLVKAPRPGLAPVPPGAVGPNGQPLSRSLLDVPLSPTAGQESRPMVSPEEGAYVGRAHNPLLTSPQDEERQWKALPWYYRTLWLPIGILVILIIWMVTGAFPLVFRHEWTVEGDPVQTPVAESRDNEWVVGDARFVPVAEFDIDALVLHRKGYTFDHMSHLSPVDLALGWGIMSDADVIKHLSIWQRNRFYFFRVPEDYPMSVDDIGRHSTNLHPIPATDDIRDQLLAIEPGERVRLRGALVDIHLPNGGFIRSSRTRTDSGAGACEVMWVESIEVLYDF